MFVLLIAQTMESKGSFDEGKREGKHADEKGYDDWDDGGKDIDSDDEVSCRSRCCVEKKKQRRDRGTIRTFYGSPQEGTFKVQNVFNPAVSDSRTKRWSFRPYMVQPFAFRNTEHGIDRPRPFEMNLRRGLFSRFCSCVCCSSPCTLIHHDDSCHPE